MESQRERNKKVAMTTLIIGYLLKLKYQIKERKKQHWWVKNWLKRRGKTGIYNALVSELALEDKDNYRMYMRMSTDCFGVENKIIIFSLAELYL